jgi:protein-S-isoprenylcysteine O-methyltransferase Ste14
LNRANHETLKYYDATDQSSVKSVQFSDFSGSERAMTVNLKLLAVEIAFLFVVIGLALFLAAGTVAWPAGWAFLVLFFGFTMAISGWLLRHSPGLLAERMTGMGQANQKTWDKVFYVVANVVFLAWLVLMPLDAVRFRWSHMPGWLQGVGAILLLCSFYLFFLTFRENAYLSPAVRLQTERAQTVVSTGPYHYVRHPMYATATIFLVGATLLLGSWYGLLLVLVLVVGIALRAVQEERTLRAELPGYEEYMAQVKYRLIPHVW